MARGLEERPDGGLSDGVEAIELVEFDTKEICNFGSLT